MTIVIIICLIFIIHFGFVYFLVDNISLLVITCIKVSCNPMYCHFWTESFSCRMLEASIGLIEMQKH